MNDFVTNKNVNMFDNY